MKESILAILLEFETRVMAKLDSYHERRMTCLGETKAYPKKMVANTVEIESEAEHEKFPKERSAVKRVAGLGKRQKGRNLAAEPCQKEKERTRGSCGSRK
jgi:hypothetical protein